MCLIVFAWQSSKDYPLIVAANRDEFHRRPTQDAHWWPDQPEILAGRDLQAGGTWFAAGKNSRFAAITNYREPSFTKGRYRSRGELVTQFVAGDLDPLKFGDSIDGAEYSAFNLLAADFRNGKESMVYFSNRGDEPTELTPGIYGLSNATLDTPWSKLTRSKKGLQTLLESGSANASTLMRVLADRVTSLDDINEDVNEDSLSFEKAKAITAPFIVTEEYGTRCSTVLLCHASGKVEFFEQRFDPAGQKTGHSQFSF